MGSRSREGLLRWFWWYDKCPMTGGLQRDRLPRHAGPGAPHAGSLRRAPTRRSRAKACPFCWRGSKSSARLRRRRSNRRAGLAQKRGRRFAGRRDYPRASSGQCSRVPRRRRLRVHPVTSALLPGSDIRFGPWNFRLRPEASSRRASLSGTRQILFGSCPLRCRFRTVQILSLLVGVQYAEHRGGCCWHRRVIAAVSGQINARRRARGLRAH